MLTSKCHEISAAIFYDIVVQKMLPKINITVGKKFDENILDF